MLTCQLANGSTWSDGMKAHLVGSSADSSCSSLALSLSLQQLLSAPPTIHAIVLYEHIIIVRISPFCLHHQQKSFIIITITYSRRGSVWFYEHRRCARESTSTFRSGRPQSSPTGRKPWGSTLSDLWQYFYTFPLGENIVTILITIFTLVHSGQSWSRRRVWWQTCPFPIAPAIATRVMAKILSQSSLEKILEVWTLAPTHLMNTWRGESNGKADEAHDWGRRLLKSKLDTFWNFILTFKFKVNLAGILLQRKTFFLQGIPLVLK